MRTIVLHTPKGGSGKSTLAREIAVAASQAGLRAALADLDPQGTTTGWYRRGAAPDPPLVRYDPSGAGNELAAAGIQILVVDTPPGQLPYLARLIELAD